MATKWQLSQGIIPAHAGSTPILPIRCRCCRDHPRSRGEHDPHRWGQRDAAGSSPLTRGARAHVWVVEEEPRIIPAHAGSTERGFGSPQRAPDHPRSRGEHLGFVLRPPWVRGSSPLTRGAPYRSKQSSSTDRIIPAHAGSTPSFRHAWKPATDHPRLRGEHALRLSFIDSPMGSSPLTRGAPLVVADGQARGRIIPAHAGSTSVLRNVPRPQTDHPRSRGEHRVSSCFDTGAVGSSPLTRGALIMFIATF